jgi:acetolactate synthase I/II/III large subunit
VTPEKIPAIALLLKYLEAEGVRTVFGIPGGPLMPLYEAMSELATIRPILTKHEQGASFMADAYARVSGTLGVCCATTGPGATNLLTGVTCAYADSIPLLVLTAQTSTGAFGKGAAQESSAHGVDVVEMFKPVTKMSAMLVSGEKMADTIRLALRAALTGRRGPVHLSLPSDLMKKLVPADLVPPKHYRAATAAVDREAVKKASQALLRAKKPAILAGHGVNLALAHPELKALAERLAIPVATSPKAKGAFPEDHLLSLGVFGFAGSPRSDAYLLSGEVDVLLVAGSSLGELVTHNWDKKLQPQTLIQIDVDPREIGKNYATAVGIAGDAKACLRELDAQLEADLRWKEDVGELVSARQDALRAFKAAHPRCQAPETLLSDAVPLKPQRVVHELRQWLPDDALLLVDIGNAMAWALHYFPVTSPDAFYLNLGMASMGHAVAGAVGAKLAAPDRPVVALCGDAAFAMNGMELHTAVEAELPVVWVVLNNQGHGMVHHGETALYGGKVSTSLFRVPIDVAAVARGLGAQTLTVKKPEELARALKAALSSSGPFVLDVHVDMAERPPMGRRVEGLRTVLAAPAEALR